MCYIDDLTLAHVLADTADAISWRRFRAQDLQVTNKPDGTPVTDADIAVEKAIRSALTRARPRDTVLGEEFEAQQPSGDAVATRQWVIDPIDGTKNFLRGVPIWATLIALLDHGRPVVGLVSAPGLGRRWWAALGSGAFAGQHIGTGSPITVSKVQQLADASLCYASLHSWWQANRGEAFLQLTRQVWRTRAYGDFYGHMLVAEGAVDVMVEPQLSLWDAAALIPIVTEAAGTLTDLAGAPYADGAGLISSNGPLHAAVLAGLTPGQKGIDP
ncbi:MAG: histidinol-phosphatase [Acidimicrobiales bacterium]|nr:MAG: histidinol-phosphatase [Acidimicrobiales bacterium]